MGISSNVMNQLVAEQNKIEDSIEEKKRLIQKKLASSANSLDLLKLRPTLRRKIHPLSQYICNKFFGDAHLFELILKISEYDPSILIKFMRVNKECNKAIQDMLIAKTRPVCSSFQDSYIDILKVKSSWIDQI